MAEFDYREFGLCKKELCKTNAFTGTADQLIAAGFATMDEFPGQPGKAKAVTRYDVDGKLIHSRRGARPSEETYRMIRRAGKKFTVLFQASDDEKKVRKAAVEAGRVLNSAAWGAQRQEERRLAARREMIERTVQDGPQNAAQARDEAFKTTELQIKLLWNLVFCSNFGAFELDLTEDDRDVLSDAFDAILDVVGTGAFKPREDLSAEIEQCRLAMGARTDTPFQAFLSKTLATRRTAGPTGRAMGAP